MKIVEMFVVDEIEDQSFELNLAQIRLLAFLDHAWPSIHTLNELKHIKLLQPDDWKEILILCDHDFIRFIPYANAYQITAQGSIKVNNLGYLV